MTNEELVQLYQQGCKQAMDELVKQNKGIVYKLANKFYLNKTNSIDIEDLEQEGFMGLMHAAEKYNADMENSAPFINYAVHWVYQKMNRFVKYRNTNDETSLDEPIGGEGEAKLVDFIEGVDYAYDNVEEQLYLKQLRQDLEGAMHEYNTLKEREVLKLRYGWDIKPLTLNEVGEIYDITGNAIRDIQQRALRKLRNNKWCRAMAEEYYIGRLSTFNTWRDTERVVDKINFAEQYFKNLDKSSLLFWGG